MSDPRGLREVLATLGQSGAEASADNPWAVQADEAADSDAAPPSPRRWRRWLIIGAVVAAVSGLGYWQREPLLGAAERIPLVGPVVHEWRAGAGGDQAGRLDPERVALAEQQRLLAQKELDLARAEADVYERQQQLQLHEDALAAREQDLNEREALFAASLPGPGINEVVDIYRNMKADAAADRLARLDDLTAITVLKRVDREHAARILAAMEAGRAAALSQALADQGTGP